MNQYADRRANAVAIVSPDPLLAALIGAAVELVGFRAAFPRPDESPLDALIRLRAAYVLIDCEDPSASDEALLGRGLMRGARLFLFGSADQLAPLRTRAARFNAELIELPRDIALLHDILSRRPQSDREPQPG